jgi:putative endonuclease
MMTKNTLGPKRDVGQKYEQLAQGYLIQKGLKPITQNFNCKTGEIDLIMLDSQAVVFVEVRYRKSTFFMSAAETINFFKQQKLSRTAEFFLTYHARRFGLASYRDSRFDVITIEGFDSDLKISWIKNAF